MPRSCLLANRGQIDVFPLPPSLPPSLPPFLLLLLLVLSKKNQIAQTNSEKKSTNVNMFQLRGLSCPRASSLLCPPLTQEQSFTGHFLILQSDLSTSLSALWAHLAVAGRGWEGADGVSGQLAVRRELGREVGLRYGG